MFKLIHEYTFEVNAPLEKTWDYFTNLNHWPKWVKFFESFHCDEELQKGSVIIGKLKNRNKSFSFLITDLVPYSESKVTFKSRFFHQESTSHFIRISPEKTEIRAKTSVKSIFIPLMRLTLRRVIKGQLSDMTKIIPEIEES